MIDKGQIFTRGESTYVKPSYVKFLRDNELYVDCSAGGLVQGPALSEGGITLLGWNKQADVFIGGCVGGWDYLLNAWVEQDHYQELNAMPQSLLNETMFTPYPIPEGTNVFTIEPRKVAGKLITPVLFFGTNAMLSVTKGHAKKYLAGLERVNRQAWQTHYVDKKPAETMSQTAYLSKHGVVLSN